MKTDYMLRKAAGDWWLVNTAQDGEHYQKPQRVNHSAAEIIERIMDGESVEEIAAEVSGRYAVPEETVMRDISELMKQLGME